MMMGMPCHDDEDWRHKISGSVRPKSTVEPHVRSPATIVEMGMACHNNGDGRHKIRGSVRPEGFVRTKRAQPCHKMGKPCHKSGDGHLKTRNGVMRRTIGVVSQQWRHKTKHAQALPHSRRWASSYRLRRARSGPPNVEVALSRSRH